MKRLLLFLSILPILSVTLTSCTAGEAQESASQASTVEISSSLQESSSDTSSLMPDGEPASFFHNDEDWWIMKDTGDEYLAELPPQLMADEPYCYELAVTIMHVNGHGGTRWTKEFDGIENACLDDLLQIALYRTPSIDFPVSFSSETGYISAEYPNHPFLDALNRELAENTHGSEALYYAQEVEKTFDVLFGYRFLNSDGTFDHRDEPPYFYLPDVEVYNQYADWGGPMWFYPQITSYEKTADGIIVEAVSIFALDKETPLEEDDVPLTKENFMELTQNEDWIRYTFKTAGDGRLVLDGVQYIRKTAQQ